MMTLSARRHLMPVWCWWLLGLTALGDVVTTLLAWHIGLPDDNPLYANPHTALGLLLVMHAIAVLVIAGVTRWVGRGIGLLCATLAALLLYLPITLINTASIVLFVHLHPLH